MRETERYKDKEETGRDIEREIEKEKRDTERNRQT